MKILLLIPPYQGISGFPLGLVSIANYLERYPQFDIEILDLAKMQLDSKEILFYLENNYSSVDVFGISVTTISYKPALYLAQNLKNIYPKSKIVFGGIHPTHYSNEILKNHPEVDFVIRGEGEIIFKNLLENIYKPQNYCHVNGISYRIGENIHDNPPSLNYISLDESGFRFDQLLDRTNYRTEIFHRQNPSASIITSRGCPYNCYFCVQSNTAIKKSIRYRSIPNIINEIRHLISLGFKHFHFEDDNFTIDSSRTINLCDEISFLQEKVSWNCETRPDNVNTSLLKKLKASGCIGIFFGIESFDQAILDRVYRNMKVDDIVTAIKSANDIGLKVFASIQVGLPGETKKSIDLTIEQLSRLKPWKIGINFASVYPGTKWFLDLNLPSDIYEYKEEPLELTELLSKYCGHGLGGIHPFFLIKIDNIRQLIVHNFEEMEAMIKRFKRELSDRIWSTDEEDRTFLSRAHK